jgi:hypothetical protein
LCRLGERFAVSPNRPEPWRYALIGGLLALPGTTYLYWQSGSELTLGPVLLGGVVAGYLYDGAERRRVGVRTGLIGGLPALWMLADALAVVPGVAGPAWFRAAAGGIGVLTILLFTLLAFALAAVAGVVGAAVGDWLSGKTGRRRSSPADG